MMMKCVLVLSIGMRESLYFEQIFLFNPNSPDESIVLDRSERHPYSSLAKATVNREVNDWSSYRHRGVQTSFFVGGKNMALFSSLQ